MKKHDKKKKKKMSEEEDEALEDIEEDVNALFGGEELILKSFKEKARVIFEAAINSKITEIKKTLEIQYMKNSR